MAFGFKQRNNQCYDTFPHLSIAGEAWTRIKYDCIHTFYILLTVTEEEEKKEEILNFYFTVL